MSLPSLCQQKTFKNCQFRRKEYWKEYKTKNESKNMTNKYRYLLESNFLRVNRLIVLIYLNQDNDAERYKAPRYYLPKYVIKKQTFMINQLILI